MYNSANSLHRLIDEFRKSMKEELEVKRQAMSSGHFTDMTQYKYECGIISGLESSLAVFNDRVKNLEVDEE